jgi:uncharacterized protein (DUF885 family)
MQLLRALLVTAMLCVLAVSQAHGAGKRSEGDASERLATLAQRYYEAQARLDPVYSATLVGDNRFDDQLPIGIAPAQRKKRFAVYHELEAQLAGIDRDRLGPADMLTHDLLARELRTRIGFEAFDDHLLPLQQMDAVPLLLATFGSGQAEQPLATVAQYDAYLKRIARLPAWAEQAIVNMREGMRRGTGNGCATRPRTT